MAYDLRDFNTTWAGKATQDSQQILNKYPYLCSREALANALSDVAEGSVSQRNPNGYTAVEMADKIITRFDEIMYDSWEESTTYDPLAFAGAVAAGYRWDQPAFWGTASTHFIFYNGGTSGDAQDIRNNIDDVVLLPSQNYAFVAKEYEDEPFLGFDKRMRTSEFGYELLTNVSNQVTGIPASATGIDDGQDPMTNVFKSLMYIYDKSYYHPTFQPNGFDSSQYSGSNPADWQTFPSSKRYDLSVAKFEVTVSGGVVTAITAVSVNDNNGDPVTGGWNYDQSTSDYRELTFTAPIDVTDGTQIAPRILYRAHTDQSGYSGNKATLNITDTTLEFYEGKGLTDGTYDAYAVYSTTDKGYPAAPDTGETFTNWYDINLPTDIDPKSVRVITERPVIKSTTRSLKEITVGTGAHRIGWEFEYPPMTQSEADAYIDFFEQAKGGANDVQIYVPHTAMPHFENLFYNVSTDVASDLLFIEAGRSVGSDEITVSGIQPGYSSSNFVGRYFDHDRKVYRVVAATNADNYGRVALRFEPPLVSASSTDIRARTTNYFRGNYFLLKARLVDDTLDYTIDAAGLYRLRFKFVEAL